MYNDNDPQLMGHVNSMTIQDMLNGIIFFGMAISLSCFYGVVQYLTINIYFFSFLSLMCILCIHDIGIVYYTLNRNDEGSEGIVRNFDDVLSILLKNTILLRRMYNLYYGEYAFKIWCILNIAVIVGSLLCLFEFLEYVKMKFHMTIREK